MKKDGDSLIPIKDVIANILSDGTLPFNPDDAEIWNVWDKVVGPAISKNARPLWIKNGKLKVSVSGPIWLQELQFVEKDIREKLNGALGRKAVERIEFRVGAQ